MVLIAIAVVVAAIVAINFPASWPGVVVVVVLVGAGVALLARHASHHREERTRAKV
jgi:hypothetical protein